MVHPQSEPPLPHAGRGPQRHWPRVPAGVDPDWPLFTVVVRGPGQMRWGVVVRAADASAARANFEMRGHQVLEVRPGVEPGPIALRNVHGNCISCGYSLARLPTGAAGEVMCPECGRLNTPAAPLEARLDVLERRRGFLRMWVYLWLGLMGAIVVALVLMRM